VVVGIVTEIVPDELPPAANAGTDRLPVNSVSPLSYVAFKER
jgi:hypothetical protein